MALCPTPLTPSCEKELQRLIAQIPDSELSVIAATEPAFQNGGFRANNTAVLRTRLTQLACGAHPISDALRRLIARRSRARTLTGTLALASLTEARHALAALIGNDVLLVSLLLDERPDVREKAESWMQSTAPFIALAPDAAQVQLTEFFSGLVDLLGVIASTHMPATHEAWQTQKDRLELRIRDLQESNRRLKGVDDRLARVTHTLAESEKKSAETQAKLKTVETALRQTSHERDDLNVNLNRETSHRDERLKAALDLALAQEFHGWLAEARAVEAVAVNTEPQIDLLARAATALTKQRTSDRHSGNRATVSERLALLETALKNVRDTLANALRPTQDLKAIESELAVEIRTLNGVLKRDTAVSPLEEAVSARIYSAEDNDLPQLRDLPDLLATLNVLDETARSRLRQAFQKRLATAQAVGVPPAPNADDCQNATNLLGRALAGHLPTILLVDGHNVLFGLPARYNPSRGTALNDAEKRKKLTEDIVRITAPNPAVRAWVVFDGPTRSDTQAAANVRVTYSGGTGEHRADGVLLDNLRFFKTTSPETAVILVSNDRDLCSEACKLGAQNVAVLNFGAFL